MCEANNFPSCCILRKIDGKNYTKSNRPGCFNFCGGGERRKADDPDKPDDFYFEKHSNPPAKKGCFIFGNTCENKK